MDLISVVLLMMLAAVLLSLALGYFLGKSGWDKNHLIPGVLGLAIVLAACMAQVKENALSAIIILWVLLITVLTWFFWLIFTKQGGVGDQPDFKG